MQRRVLLDTGPLVALLNRRDGFHVWAKAQWAKIEPPLLTCEPVLAESCFLLSGLHHGVDAVMDLLEKQVIQVEFSVELEKRAIRSLLAQYESVPMSLADACLVRMSELNPNSPILTIDSDFTIYRKHRDQVIPLLMPGF